MSYVGFVFVFKWTSKHWSACILYVKSPMERSLPFQPCCISWELVCRMYRRNQLRFNYLILTWEVFTFWVLWVEDRRSFLQGVQFCILEKAGTESLGTSGNPEHHFNGRSDQISQRNPAMTDVIPTDKFTIFYHRAQRKANTDKRALLSKLTAFEMSVSSLPCNETYL